MPCDAENYHKSLTNNSHEKGKNCQEILSPLLRPVVKWCLSDETKDLKKIITVGHWSMFNTKIKELINFLA